MKTVLAIRHVYFEGLGIFEALLTDLDFNIEYIDATTFNFDSVDPLDTDFLVVLGAPVGAFEEETYPFIKQELAFIGKRLKANKPLLGICLGAQFIARLLGAKVYSVGEKEIGFGVMQIHDTPSNPVSKLKDIPVLHWHGDQFDIPKGCISLAATEICSNQAFAFGNNVLALQFHMEANPANLEQWLVGHACELSAAKIDIQKIRYDAAKYGDALTAAAKDVFLNWLDSTDLQL